MDAPLKGGVFAHHMHFDVAPADFPPHEPRKCPAARPAQRSDGELTSLLRGRAAASAAHFDAKLRRQRARPLFELYAGEDERIDTAGFEGLCKGLGHALDEEQLQLAMTSLDLDGRAAWMEVARSLDVPTAPHARAAHPWAPMARLAGPGVQLTTVEEP